MGFLFTTTLESTQSFMPIIKRLMPYFTRSRKRTGTQKPQIDRATYLTTVASSLTTLMVAFGAVLLNNRWEESKRQVEVVNDFIRNVELYTYASIASFESENQFQVDLLQSVASFKTHMDNIKPGRSQQFNEATFWLFQDAVNSRSQSDKSRKDAIIRLQEIGTNLSVLESTIYEVSDSTLDKELGAIMIPYFSELRKFRKRLVLDYIKLGKEIPARIPHDKYDSAVSVTRFQMDSLGNRTSYNLTLLLRQSPTIF